MELLHKLRGPSSELMIAAENDTASTAVQKSVDPGPTTDTPKLVAVPSKNNVCLETSSGLRRHNVTADVRSRQGCHDNPLALTIISEANLYAEAQLRKHTQ